MCEPICCCLAHSITEEFEIILKTFAQHYSKQICIEININLYTSMYAFICLADLQSQVLFY